MARGRKIENPPHWYFPISKREMHRRRMKNIDKALKKMGMTRKDLKNMDVKKVGRKRRK